MPTLNCSVMAISTWVSLRVGPRTRTLAMRPLGPTRCTFSAQANWPGWDSSCSGVSWWPGPKSFSTSACDRCTWWAEISMGMASALVFGFISRMSWLRSMARRVSQATRRSSSLVMTRMVTGESSAEMMAWEPTVAEVAVLLLVELDAHVAEALAGQAAHRGTGFADVAGEGQHVDAAHRRHVGADVLAHLVAEGLVGEQGAVVAVRWRRSRSRGCCWKCRRCP
jgi:hypothetical protein